MWIHNRLGMYTFANTKTLYFEMIIDSQEVAKMLQRGPTYPLPCFPHWLHLRTRKLTLVQCVSCYDILSHG